MKQEKPAGAKLKGKEKKLVPCYEGRNRSPWHRKEKKSREGSRKKKGAKGRNPTQLDSRRAVKREIITQGG